MARPSVQWIEENRPAHEWLKAADELSQRVAHTDARTAFARVRDGEYEGTPFAAKLRGLMFLAGEDKPLPRAAE
jgi:hypothetical protein